MNLRLVRYGIVSAAENMTTAAMQAAALSSCFGTVRRERETCASLSFSKGINSHQLLIFRLSPLQVPPMGQRPSPAGTAHATRPRTNWPGLVTRVNSSPRPRRSSSADRSPSNQARIRRAARYPLTLSGSFRSPAAQEDRLRLWLSQLHAFCGEISRSVRSFTSRSRLRSRLTRGAFVPPKGR
jgi:hypothetical protein